MKGKLENKLDKRIEEGTYRSLSSFESNIDFWSNDYLGLAKLKSSPSEIERFGGTGSRLIAGNTKVIEEVESSIAQFFNSEAALVFNSGYDANLGFFSAVPQKGDLILFDDEIHASVRDGVRLSFAKSHSFKHNDLADLEKKLTIEADEKYVAIESLYSMSGDIGAIGKIAQLCKKHNAKLIVDEAHAAGVYGENGTGICAAIGLETEVFARLVTFGKAYGSHGAAILSANLVRNYLINFARSFIYTTALPISSYLRIQELMNHESLEVRRNNLFKQIAFFRNLMENTNVALISEVNSPIQMIRIGNVEKTNQLVAGLQESGFAVKAILSPTVAKGDEGIRICIHSFNTEDEIRRLVGLIKI